MTASYRLKPLFCQYISIWFSQFLNQPLTSQELPIGPPTVHILDDSAGIGEMLLMGAFTEALTPASTPKKHSTLCNGIILTVAKKGDGIKLRQIQITLLWQNYVSIH